MIIQLLLTVVSSILLCLYVSSMAIAFRINSAELRHGTITAETIQKQNLFYLEWNKLEKPHHIYYPMVSFSKKLIASLVIVAIGDSPIAQASLLEAIQFGFFIYRLCSKMDCWRRYQSSLKCSQYILTAVYDLLFMLVHLTATIEFYTYDSYQRAQISSTELTEQWTKLGECTATFIFILILLACLKLLMQIAQIIYACKRKPSSQNSGVPSDPQAAQPQAHEPQTMQINDLVARTWSNQVA
jgi:hypothetical protein